MSSQNDTRGRSFKELLHLSPCIVVDFLLQEIWYAAGACQVRIPEIYVNYNWGHLPG